MLGLRISLPERWGGAPGWIIEQGIGMPASTGRLATLASFSGRGLVYAPPTPLLKEGEPNPLTPPFKNTFRLLFLFLVGQGLRRHCKRPFRSAMSRGQLCRIDTRPGGDRVTMVPMYANPRLWMQLHECNLERESMQTNLEMGFGFVSPLKTASPQITTGHSTMTSY